MPDRPLKKLTRARVFTGLGLLLVIVIWQVLSLFVHEILMASPAQTLSTLWDMLGTPYFKTHFSVSLQRVFLGLVLGIIVGFSLGVAAGLNRDIKHMLAPVRWLMLSISPVVLVVLAMLWFGMGTRMVVFIATALTAPIIYVNTVKGIEMVDERLVEMADIYRFGLWLRIKDLYVPAITGPLSAAMVLVTCMGARVVILAEIMGADNGIGFALGEARSNLEVPTLFAWVLVSLVIVALFEFVLVGPVERYFTRWKR